LFTFWIDEGATTENEVGSYVVKVELSNSGGGSAIYSFSVVIDVVPEEIILEEEEEVITYSPIPSIK
jgi:hypothetical protein